MKFSFSRLCERFFTVSYYFHCHMQSPAKIDSENIKGDLRQNHFNTKKILLFVDSRMTYIHLIFSQVAQITKIHARISIIFFYNVCIKKAKPLPHFWLIIYTIKTHTHTYTQTLYYNFYDVKYFPEHADRLLKNARLNYSHTTVRLTRL